VDVRVGPPESGPELGRADEPVVVNYPQAVSENVFHLERKRGGRTAQQIVMLSAPGIQAVNESSQ